MAPLRAASVPAPHVRLLPPTSPRRNVRRSVLKLLASQEAQTATTGRGRAGGQPSAEEPPPRIARKLIIRHVSHALPTPPVPSRSASEVTSPQPAQELAPETIKQPSPVPPSPAIAPLPSTTPKKAAQAPMPESAPLNEMAAHWELLHDLEHNLTSPIAVRGHWDAAGPSAPLVLIAEPAEIEPPGAESLALVQLDALPEPAPQERRTTARLDPPQALSESRPHVRFDRAQSVPPAPPTEDPPSALAYPAHAELDPEEIRSLLDQEQPETELTLAEPIEAAQGETAHDEPVLAEVATPTTKPAPVTARFVPQWELDRFHWPKTCEKLLADASGYLAHAGEKLRAAAKDGLKVLGITGTRRGEGRTTLALCLARVAADAGLSVALMDADFLRPQIASKLGIEVAFGWQDAALGKVPLSEAAVKSLLDNVTVLPLETSAARGRLSLADPRVTATIRAAAATFDLVILDQGPLAGDELSFPPGEACPLDAAIVVRDLRFATAAESETVGQALYDAGIEAVGIAENFVVEEEAALAPS
jgi:Mrp family chromosome partitioning ATPase